jgi:hypothetical protein
MTAIVTVFGASDNMISTLTSTPVLHFSPVQLAQELGKKVPKILCCSAA